MNPTDPLEWTTHDVQVWRAAMQWSLSQAAAALGVNKSTITDWERNGRIPRTAVLACRALSFAKFIKGTVDAYSQPIYAEQVRLQMSDLVATLNTVDNNAPRGRPRTVDVLSRHPFTFIADGVEHPIVSGLVEQVVDRKTGQQQYLARLTRQGVGRSPSYECSSLEDAKVRLIELGPAGHVLEAAPIDGEEAFLMQTRRFYYTLGGRRHVNTQAHVESYCNDFPGSSFIGTDFYYGRVVELGRSIKCSQAFRTREETEDWLAENGPPGHCLEYHSTS